MKKILILNMPVLLLLLLASCQLERTSKPAPPNKTAKIILHSDLPIIFNANMRDKETRRFFVLLNRYREQKGLGSSNKPLILLLVIPTGFEPVLPA